MKRILFLLCVFSCIATAFASRPVKLVSAIESLDSAIGVRHDFTALRRARIDSLKTVLSHTSPALKASKYRELASQFRDIDADSAHLYLAQARKALTGAPQPDLKALINIDFASQLARNMMYADALAVLDSINASDLPLPVKIQYYSTLSRVCIDGADRYTAQGFKSALSRRALVALDSLTGLFPDNSLAQRISRAQRMYSTGDQTLGAGELIDIFEEMPSDYPGYAIVTSMLAKYYKENPAKHDEYVYYLTLSAIHDIKSANGEPASLIALAGEMFADGEIDRSYNYLTAATEALNSSKATLLSAEMLDPVSKVGKTIHARELSVKRTYGIASLILLVLLALAIFLYVRERRRAVFLRQRIESLDDSVSSRELYISQLLDICSVYVEGMEEFNRLVGRKLKAGQAKDLYDMIESGRVLQEQTDRFFTVFDAAVLRIFPRFAEQLNSLLLPDRQIQQPSGGKLSPEQRIIAFMLLGVYDSTRISKFLGLSLNTVYTYRNRIKSRAADRENFEENLKKISKNP